MPFIPCQRCGKQTPANTKLKKFCYKCKYKKNARSVRDADVKRRKAMWLPRYTTEELQNEINKRNNEENNA